jgi:hypothetical protein
MHSSKRWLTLLAFLAGLLAGCETADSKGSVCPPIFSYSADYQLEAAEELEAIVEDGFIVIPQMMADYGATRAALRACQ